MEATMSEDLMKLVGGCPVYETSDSLEQKGQEVIEEYRELGFTKATEEPYQKNLEILKRQRIYEFEYRVITTEAIRKFLQRKVGLYDKEHKPKPKKKKRSDVFDLEALERLREEVRRSCGIPLVFFGRPDHSESGAQQQLDIHRQQGLLEAADERRHQRDHQRDIHQVLHAINNDSNPTWVYSIGRGTRSVLPPFESIYEKTCDYDKYDPETIGRFEWKEERVEDYEGLPPAPVIETFKEHKARKVFDYFTIASVNSVPDPLLLGRIDGDDDNRWFIAQWGADVCLDDLI
jgi:hypothetical protein